MCMCKQKGLVEATKKGLGLPKSGLGDTNRKARAGTQRRFEDDRGGDAHQLKPLGGGVVE